MSRHEPGDFFALFHKPYRAEPWPPAIGSVQFTVHNIASAKGRVLCRRHLVGQAVLAQGRGQLLPGRERETEGAEENGLVAPWGCVEDKR